MKCAYSVARITRRWTLVIFFSFLNIAGINAYVVFKNNTNSTLDRNDFLIQLAKELIDGVLRMRITMTNLPVSIRLRVREILGLPELTPQRLGDQKERTHGRCSLCDRKKNRPTRFTCKGCNKYVCLGHVVGHICSECVEKVQVIQIDNEADQE
uniref:Uncharacterized protein n=1 Tax=Clastoptera arizonana TaxID=38151 RepID=A0A1B6EFV8_9HEMI